MTVLEKRFKSMLR